MGDTGVFICMDTVSSYYDRKAGCGARVRLRGQGIRRGGGVLLSGSGLCGGQAQRIAAGLQQAVQRRQPLKLEVVPQVGVERARRRRECLKIRYVETTKLTVALSQIGELRAQEVVNLSDRRRSIPGALLAGFFRRLWMSLTARVPVDAEYVPIEDTPESALETLEPDLGNGDAPDFEAFAPPPGALNADRSSPIWLRATVSLVVST